MCEKEKRLRSDDICSKVLNTVDELNDDNEGINIRYDMI